MIVDRQQKGGQWEEEEHGCRFVSFSFSHFSFFFFLLQNQCRAQKLINSKLSRQKIFILVLYCVCLCTRKHNGILRIVVTVVVVTVVVVVPAVMCCY